MKKTMLLSISVLIVLVLAILSCPLVSLGEDINYRNYDIIRNGDFEEGDSAWFTRWSNVIGSAKKDGEYGLRLQDISTNDRYAFQELMLPTVLNSATIEFDYRALTYYSNPLTPGILQVSIGKSSGFETPQNLFEISPLETIGIIHQEVVDQVTDWRELRINLSQSLIAAMQGAHEAGEYVFLVFSHFGVDGPDGHTAITDIDNLAFTINGLQRVPEMIGQIAYYQKNSDRKPVSVNIIDPVSQVNKTVWTHPEGYGTYGEEVVWSPDGSELCFTSDFEDTAAFLDAELYLIQPDGSHLRNLSGPEIIDVDDDTIPRVTVTGTVNNSSSKEHRIAILIQGSQSGYFMVLPGGGSDTFTVPDVPVIDNPNTFTQVITMHYSSSECNHGVIYHVPADMVVNDQVTLDITFIPSNCPAISGSGWTVPREINWKHDGSQILFRMLGFKSLPIEFGSRYNWTDIEPDGGSFGNSISWSPIDERYLFVGNLESLYYDSLYVAEIDGEPIHLTDNINDYTKPSWLPDASGFAFIGQGNMHNFNDNIFLYDFNTNSEQRLTYWAQEDIENVSVSADGKYLVYEHKINPGLSYQYQTDFWIMNIHNPVERWRLTSSGNCSNPDWSKADTPIILDHPLQETILFLKILNGTAIAVPPELKDCNGDNKLGMEEVIDSLKRAATEGQ